MAYKKLELAERDYEIIKNLIALGKTEKQIAQVYGISPSALTWNKSQDKRLKEVLAEGLTLQLADVVGKLYLKAVGFVQEEVEYAGDKVVKRKTKTLAPDTMAIAMILNNRAPDLWKQNRIEEGENKKVILNVSLSGKEYAQLEAAKTKTEKRKKKDEIEADYVVIDE